MAVRPNSLVNFFDVPDVPTGYPVLPNWSIVVPVNRDVTNLVVNPSGELNDTGWTDTNQATGADQTASQQYFGSYSITRTVAATSSNPGLRYSSVSLVSGTTYVLSAYVFCTHGGITFDLELNTTGNVILARRRYKTTGFWQRVWLPYKESSTTTRDFNIRQADMFGFGAVFYVDGAQVEAIPSGGLVYPTTYIDGDQTGLTPNEFPLPYYWNGTAHASTSVRTQFTRSGGRIVNLRDLGFLVVSVVGMGLVTPNHTSLPYGQLDGEVYQRTQKNARTFSIAGRSTGRSAAQLDMLFSSLSRELDSDSGVRREPLVVKYQPMDEQENPIGPELSIVATYDGGLEGIRDNLSTEVFTASFKQYLPNVIGHSEGASLSVNTTVSDADGIIRRLPDGTWDSLSTGLDASGEVRAIALHEDGTIYVGGIFTDAGGSGADFAAKYDPVTDTFSVIKAATSFNNTVEAIVIDAAGIVYFGGAFTNVDGIAAADGIVSYNPNTNTFSALGTGVNAGGVVFSLALTNTGNLIAGGTFTLMGGVANTVRIASWNGSAWSALGTGALDNGVLALITRGTTIYAGGSFTQIGGVANTSRLGRWDGSAWNAMSTGANDTVYAFEFGVDSNLYIGGNFTTLGGITINYFGKWNGVTFLVVGSPSVLNGLVSHIESAPDGTFYISGAFTTVNGISIEDRVLRVSGEVFNNVGVDLPGSPTSEAILVDSRSGTLYIGFNTTGSATAEAITTVNHSGTGRAQPIIVFNGPSSGSSRLYMIRNPTTGSEVYFNYTILSGEIAILDFKSQRFISNFQGDISYTITPGSNEANFFLCRGDNRISVLATGSPTMNIYWDQSFLSASDAVGVT